MSDTEKELVAFAIEELVDDIDDGNGDYYKISNGTRVSVRSMTTYEQQITFIVNREIIHKVKPEKNTRNI